MTIVKQGKHHNQAKGTPQASKEAGEAYGAEKKWKTTIDRLKAILNQALGLINLGSAIIGTIIGDLASGFSIFWSGIGATIV